ncbi:T6SS immunity protein Tli4 family protein [Trinickia sp. LjRoot230]|uniref:T6SS immunity protein Tli4 family protein n=1 Tax=Trinickia sp. LjRoot230 TaxID=3342288 RepID=UPI003ECE2BE3
MTETLTTQMRAVCIGRFVMTVPKDMTFDGRVTLYYDLDAGFKTVDVNIKSLDATPKAMRTQTDAEAEAIDKGDKNSETQKSMLLDHRVISEHMIYLRKQAAILMAGGSEHELHLLKGKTQLLLKARSYENIPEAGRYLPNGKVETPEQVAERLFQLAKRIHSYDDPETAGPGFCLGPVVIDSDNDEEIASMSFTTDKYPGLVVSIYSKALMPDDPSEYLLKRIAAAEAHPDIHALRRGTTTLGGMQAQEWLVKTSDGHGNEALAFVVESVHREPALERPLMSIELDTGGQLTNGPNSGQYVGSSLTPHEAVAVWDTIVSSVRIRPNAIRPKTNTGA